MEPTAIINPKIISHSEDIECEWENCLSVSGLSGLVPRGKSVNCKIYNAGRKISQSEIQWLRCADFPA